ncbi:predicted protein [Verticillium alfalfae VaMs.102]|uniref:Predicted protein n=1 Tax=Verticillium alfalfae (strain VaMs.102 / ATCC MYA-4576 / FGSC 10136) TaxID=526221 RepID=C9S965_VERA1|nr:predicted protein [Verticillium alfalfae VaMs.102]EEY14113.1 predicted protein [Verticillium alfalfae VaMs.102]
MPASGTLGILGIQALYRCFRPSNSHQIPVSPSSTIDLHPWLICPNKGWSVVMGEGQRGPRRSLSVSSALLQELRPGTVSTKRQRFAVSGLGARPGSLPCQLAWVVIRPLHRAVPGRPGGFVQFLCRAGPRFAEIRRRRSERRVPLVRHLASSPPAMQFGEANQAADLMAGNPPKSIQAQWEETLRRLCAATPLKGHSCRRLLHCARPAEHEVDEVRQRCALLAFRLSGLAAAQLGLLPVSGFRCIAGEGLREPNLVKGSLPADTLRHVSTHNSESSSRVVSTPTCLDTPTLSGQWPPKLFAFACCNPWLVWYL